MTTEKQRAAWVRTARRADFRLAKELLAVLPRNGADRVALRRRIRAILRRVEREGV